LSDPSWSAQDFRYIRRACRLARKAAGRTSPNPTVGAVLVRGGRVVGAGYHRFAGGDHAEIAALKQAGAKARGATLYITLEPCSHQGRTPPCTRALIQAGIKEVVCGARDPNPLVSGRGFRKLRSAGIRVRVGILQDECSALIEGFAKFITRRLPFVILKLAATFDGKIAAANGDARWISGEASRKTAHRLRNEVDAVIVGIGTVKTDDPQLTCRIAGGRNPWRIVLDRRLEIKSAAVILRQSDPAKTIVVTGPGASKTKSAALAAGGAQIWPMPLRAGRIAWLPLLRKLASLDVVSVMIEGGAAVAASALETGIVDKIVFFYAPKLLGGDARSMIGPLGRRRVRDALAVKNVRIEKSGADLMVTGYL